jgi:hypothetical protein
MVRLSANNDSNSNTTDITIITTTTGTTTTTSMTTTYKHNNTSKPKNNHNANNANICEGEQAQALFCANYHDKKIQFNILCLDFAPSPFTTHFL